MIPYDYSNHFNYFTLLYFTFNEFCWENSLEFSSLQGAADELKEDHAQGPQVHLSAVAMAAHDLWSHVVRRADPQPTAAIRIPFTHSFLYSF